MSIWHCAINCGTFKTYSISSRLSNSVCGWKKKTGGVVVVLFCVFGFVLLFTCCIILPALNTLESYSSSLSMRGFVNVLLKLCHTIVRRNMLD